MQPPLLEPGQSLNRSDVCLADWPLRNSKSGIIKIVILSAAIFWLFRCFSSIVWVTQCDLSSTTKSSKIRSQKKEIVIWFAIMACGRASWRVLHRRMKSRVETLASALNCLENIQSKKLRSQSDDGSVITEFVKTEFCWIIFFQFESVLSVFQF